MRQRFIDRIPLRCVLLLTCLCAPGAARAADAPDEPSEEARIWQQEEQLLEKAALEKDGYNPLERSYVGLVRLEKGAFDEDEKTHPQTVDVGRFSTKGYEFVLRVERADLLDVLRKVEPRKPVSLVGTVRANGKYFVARDVSLAIPGEGSAAPQVRGRRGGL